MNATILTNASANEIADLVFALQGQRDREVKIDFDMGEFSKAALATIHDTPEDTESG